MATLMRKTSGIVWASIIMAAFLISNTYAAVSTGDIAAGDPKPVTSYRISAINWGDTPAEYTLRIEGGIAPTYTMYELFEPLRVIIDVADASIEPGVVLPMDISGGPVSLVTGKVLEDKEPFITRVELYLSEDRSYTVERIDNDIVVKFPKAETEPSLGEEPASDTAVIAADSPVGIAAEPSAFDIDTIPPTTDSASSEPSAALSLSETSPEAADDAALTEAGFESSDQPRATVVYDIEVKREGGETKVYLKADGPIKDYRKVQLTKNVEANRPDRVYIDLKNLRLSGSFEARHVGTALAQIRAARRQDGFRVVFDSGLDHLFDYTISEAPDGLVLTVTEPSPATAVIAGLISESPESEVAPEPEVIAEEPAPALMSSLSEADEATLDDLEPAKPALPKEAGDSAKTAKPTKPKSQKSVSAPDLGFAGYNKQRITVDFYKIDLHNVFRLFGEISNLNIVVDEAVNGSLTLSLNDVPWDFALDIILNLKDLQKEERFNTIVISPKSKVFTWPTRALESIQFKADITIQQAEDEKGGIKISKKLELPETVVEAKKLIHQAQVQERNGNYNAALPIYEDAFAKWSDNINLAKRISSLCLVNLEQNAKAIYYAKAALKLSPADQEAALQAAIGLARMKRDSEAKEFFEKSVGGSKPPSEALVSYSAYCEDMQDYGCSLSLLKRNEDLYGDTLPSLVSKARVYDKQGRQDLAAAEYQAILLSGYEIPPDLARYIKGRASLGSR